jgi:nucleotide-binding universal stress UspA family protein
MLLAIDRSAAGEAALDFTIGLASGWDARITVLHVRELSPLRRMPPLESLDEARELVEQSMARIDGAGLGAGGLVHTATSDAVARCIVEASSERWCDGIVLGSHRQRGIRRLAGGGVRDQVMRSSALPVFVAPPALRCGRPKWAEAFTHASGA